MNKASAKMIKLTFKVNGLKTLGDLPPQGRAAVLNAAAGRVRSVVEEHFDSLPSRRFWKEAADDVVVAPQWTTREGKDAPVRVLGQLVKSATDKENKKVMPTREKMETAARKGAEHILRRLDIQPKN